MDELLVKYLLGEASESEVQNVASWIAENSGNRRHFEQIKLIWDASKGREIQSTIDTDAAWERFKLRTAQEVRSEGGRGIYKWVRVAAILIMLAGVGWLIGVATHNGGNPVAGTNTDTNNLVSNWMSWIVPGNSAEDTLEKEIHAPRMMKRNSVATKNSVSESSNRSTAGTDHGHLKEGKQPPKRMHHRDTDDEDVSENFVCNSTSCPIEICIIQKIVCKDGRPSEVATCSLLEPDQSGALKYEAFDKIAAHCEASVEEIRIKRVSTGETIVLNASSKPSTAQDLFNYITMRKKGDIMAGVFHTNCNNDPREHSLKLENESGDLIFQ